MITKESFRQIALSFPETTEEPHFEKPAFKVAKKIFATMNLVENRATIKLTPADQDVFCLYDEHVMYPVPNKWGKQGWTHINLQIIPEEMCLDALRTAYCSVAPKRLADQVRLDEDLE
jgi:predicted DNA-binding protein (MmcQ/YjbR family)